MHPVEVDYLLRLAIAALGVSQDPHNMGAELFGELAHGIASAAGLWRHSFDSVAYRQARLPSGKV
jgi:hypothetical protein